LSTGKEAVYEDDLKKTKNAEFVVRSAVVHPAFPKGLREPSLRSG
jgi:hypothetical protein